MFEDYLVASCACFELASDTKEGAIRELVSLLAEAGRVTDQETFCQAVFEREEIDATGMGDGFAVPHGKSSSVVTASVAYGRATQGYAWKSLDGKPVTDIFLLAVPEGENEAHLEMLSALARKLMHRGVRQALRASADVQALYQALE